MDMHWRNKIVCRLEAFTLIESSCMFQAKPNKLMQLLTVVLLLIVQGPNKEWVRVTKETKINLHNIEYILMPKVVKEDTALN